jgi:hypothetical protein
MIGAACLTIALLGVSATDQEAWRAKEVSGVQAEGMTLPALVATLAAQTHTPIHLVYDAGMIDDPVIRGIDAGSKTNLGLIFDRIAERVPGLRAVPTGCGVIWIGPIRELVRRPLEAEFELQDFVGSLDDLMSECFLSRVVGMSNGWSYPEQDPARKRVNVRNTAGRVALDVAVAGFEQNKACLRIHLMLDPPQPGDDPGFVPRPRIDYSLIPLQSEQGGLRRPRVVAD